MENTEFGLDFPPEGHMVEVSAEYHALPGRIPPEGPMVEVSAEYHALPGRIAQMVGVPRSRAFWCQIGGSCNTPLRGPPSAEYFRIRVFRENQVRFASKGVPRPPGVTPIRPRGQVVRVLLVAVC